MKPESRHRLLTIALELRLRSRASSTQNSLALLPSRLIEIAEVLESMAKDDDEAAANVNDPSYSSEDAAVVDLNR